MNVLKLLVACVSALLLPTMSMAAAPSPLTLTVSNAHPVHYRTVQVDGRTMFYREAGDASAPVVLLLHGFPGSSFAYRDLIPLLSDRYHVIAPDLLGYGYSDSPPRSEFTYNFDNLEVTVDRLTQVLGLKRYVLYLCDNGAVVGFRMAVAHPERVLAIISQNGNAYAEGVSGDDWAPLRKAWNDPTLANRAEVRKFVEPELTKFQWTVGVPDPSLISPDTYNLATMVQSRGDNTEAQTDLLIDYASEELWFPRYQAYFRKYRPPLLATWGKDDPFFTWQAAVAFKRDLPKAEVYLYPTSHFALETHSIEIATKIRRFLARNLSVRPATDARTAPARSSP